MWSQLIMRHVELSGSSFTYAQLLLILLSHRMWSNKRLLWFMMIFLRYKTEHNPPKTIFTQRDRSSIHRHVVMNRQQIKLLFYCRRNREYKKENCFFYHYDRMCPIQWITKSIQAIREDIQSVLYVHIRLLSLRCFTGGFCVVAVSLMFYVKDFSFSQIWSEIRNKLIKHRTQSR